MDMKDVVAFAKSPAALTIASALINGVPGVVLAVGNLIAASNAGRDPTDEELQALIDEAGDAHAKLQDAAR